jgi:aspartate racemase
MGPEATVWLMGRVIKLTPAVTDQDHIPLLVNSNTQVPSRIDSIINQSGDDPTPILSDMARQLEFGGAKALAMACNTAHFYADDIQRRISIPLLRITDLTAQYIASMISSNKDSPVKRVGLLASPAVRITNIFGASFKKHGIEQIFPPNDSIVLESIVDVKSGRIGPCTISRLSYCASQMISSGAEVIVLACSELSTLHNDLTLTTPIVDSIDVLANAIVDYSIHGRFAS